MCKHTVRPTVPPFYTEESVVACGWKSLDEWVAHVNRVLARTKGEIRFDDRGAAFATVRGQVLSLGWQSSLAEALGFVEVPGTRRGHAATWRYPSGKCPLVATEGQNV